MTSRHWTAGLLALALAEGLIAVIGGIVTDISFAAARDSFMVTNWLIGVSCACCGALIAWNRPRSLLGWFLLGAGIAQTATPAVTPWLIQALQNPSADPHLPATIYSFMWPWSVSLFIPLALLYFPDGRLPGRIWKLVVAAVLVNAPVQVVLFSADSNPLAPVRELGPQARDRAVSWLGIPSLEEIQPLVIASEIVLVGGFLAGLASLVLRYRRGTEQARRQLLWLLLAATIALTVIGWMRLGHPESLDGYPIIVSSLAALIPVAMAIAVLRYQLLDIRLVWARTVTYLLLTAAVAGTYLLVVELADQLFRGVGASVLATLLVAAGFNPVRVRLQRQVDRLLYGERADPIQAAASVTASLAEVAERPADVLPAVCNALRLPYAVLSDASGLLGEYGVRPERLEVVTLKHAGEQVGELCVGVRSGERKLGPADRAVLDLMAVPIGVALRAQALSEAVQLSRREIVATREEERRRLRRDLHDGLGPMLTGLGFRADAVVNLADDADRVRMLGAGIREGIDAAIVDVRRLIYRLQPTALDDVGLVEAVRRHARLLDRRVDGVPLVVTVRSGPALPTLPAAVEVAAYRIVTEALTNVARHSGATRVEVRIGEDSGELTLTVSDDGPAAWVAEGAAPEGVNGAWVPGVGLRSMLERVTELGGRMQAEPTPAGGRVHACLPFGATR